MEEQVDQFYQSLKGATENLGQFLNPDIEFTKDLVRGLMKNKERYGYTSCPCRLASGVLEKDSDIICPCFYRDPDVAEFGNCYCSLYVSKEINDGTKKTHSIPERRPKELRTK
ncbi:MAG: ferredoxin-thioredoxin reductase catalytic domain-containing protein [Patescibacteria group bacterium]|nr:ferredoxin-thioredoxin reductase catalytic domain-containing protein [Patescibacteria group bacterium]